VWLTLGRVVLCEICLGAAALEKELGKKRMGPKGEEGSLGIHLRGEKNSNVSSREERTKEFERKRGGSPSIRKKPED